MPKVSIIIRTKNEEKWIGHCLSMIYKQTEKDYEIILIDNNSDDGTVDIAKRFGVNKIIFIENYLPGASLNKGIEVSRGEYIVCLSAHCIPVDEFWIENLIKGFKDEKIVGIYGRQIPLSFSEDGDKRDLLITFGLDRRLQKKDYFFHNANSAIRKSILKKYPFDSAVTNIEDRIWAKIVTENNYYLLYEPDAIVYHHHGIHHNGNSSRLKSTVKVLEGMENTIKKIPDSMLPEKVKIAAICPVVYKFNSKDMDKLIFDIRNCSYIDDIYIISELVTVEEYCKINKINFIKRPDHLMPKNATIEEILKYALFHCEKNSFFPELILYTNYQFHKRPPKLFENIIEKIQYKGIDTVFPASEDYHNYWVKK